MIYKTTTGEVVEKLVEELIYWIEDGICTLDNCEAYLSDYLESHFIYLDPDAKYYIITKTIKRYKEL